MLRISIKDTHGKSKLVLQGKLVAPWTAEVESAWRDATERLEGRKLVIDLNDVTFVSPEGEDMLLKLMCAGAHFTSCGVLTKHMLNRLAHRCREAVARAHGSPRGCENGEKIGEKLKMASPQVHTMINREERR